LEKPEKKKLKLGDIVRPEKELSAKDMKGIVGGSAGHPDVDTSKLLESSGFHKGMDAGMPSLVGNWQPLPPTPQGNATYTNDGPHSETKGAPPLPPETKGDDRDRDDAPQEKKDSKSTPDHKADGKADQKTDMKSDAKADQKTDMKSDAKADGKADQKTDMKSDAKADGKADQKTDMKSDAKADAKPDGKADAKADLKEARKESVEAKEVKRVDNAPDTKPMNKLPTIGMNENKYQTLKNDINNYIINAKGNAPIPPEQPGHNPESKPAPEYKPVSMRDLIAELRSQGKKR